MKPTIGTYLDDSKAAVIDLPRLVELRMLIQASSGYGKSRALRRLLEVTAGKVQQIVIDPEGEFSSLREKHDFVICAPQGGDALAHPKTAALLARRLLETEASAVLDIYELKARERHEFVRLFVDALVNAPKTLWHPVLVVLDEAHMFCPEKGMGESVATNSIIDLASLGRKRGFALVAATQRISKFNKSAAAELKTKLIGSCGEANDVKRAAFELGLPPTEAMQLLRALQPGHFYGFGPALHQLAPRELITGNVETTHPQVGSKRALAPPKPTPAIIALLPQLADLPKEAEAEARSIEDLKRELTNVRRELAVAKKAQPVASDTTTTQSLRVADATMKRLKGAIEALMKFVIQINATDFAKDAGVDPEAIRKAIDSAVGQAMKLVDQKLEAREKSLQTLQREGGRLIASVQKLLSDQEITVAVDVKRNEPFTVKATPAPARERATNGSTGSIARGETAVLSACIQFPGGLRREQITVLTGYKRSTRDAYIQRLREKGFVEGNGDLITATDDGCAALPDAEPLPTGAALQDYWFNRLPEGERAILQVLVQRYPAAVPRDTLTDETNYKRSTRDAYLQRLTAKQLVAEPSRGEVRASETLF